MPEKKVLLLHQKKPTKTAFDYKIVSIPCKGIGWGQRSTQTTMSSKTEAKKAPFWHRAFYLYYDGFRSMSRTSKVLWTLALIKLFIMFAILRPFFFPRIVGQQGDKVQQANFVMEQITHEK